MKPINSEMAKKSRNDWDGPASQEPGENLHVFGNRFGAQIWAAKSEFGKFFGSAVLYASLIEDYETNAADLEIQADRKNDKKIQAWLKARSEATRQKKYFDAKLCASLFATPRYFKLLFASNSAQN